ncbi:hypothetical protein EFD55_30745 [Rhizobium pisi]|uniref:Uncharacterized protein n=1 Tax=Rhizobium pisi TaxID=574561 RepID=A0A3R9A987_9HYPH|nr:hypothetical protein EFD55_30745 [Rhizobium pisi]
MKIIFDDIVLRRVTLSQFIVWNIGRDRLIPNDIADDGSLIFKLEGDGRILNYELIRSSRPENKASLNLQEDAKTLVAKFDFFAPKEGVKIEILHSGEGESLKFHCTIRDRVGALTVAPLYEPPNKHMKFFGFMISPRTMGWICVALGGFALVFMFMIPADRADFFYPLKVSPEIRDVLRRAMPGGFILYCAGVLFWLTRRRFPKSLV